MKGKYIALKEAAELEGIEYNTLVVNIQRSDNYIIKKEADTTNGGINGNTWSPEAYPAGWKVV